MGSARASWGIAKCFPGEPSIKPSLIHPVLITLGVWFVCSGWEPEESFTVPPARKGRWEGAMKPQGIIKAILVVLTITTVIVTHTGPEGCEN